METSQKMDKASGSNGVRNFHSRSQRAAVRTNPGQKINEAIEYAVKYFDAWTTDSMESKYLLYVFPQTWNSTALGFDGPNAIGGAAMTTALTFVIHNGHQAVVFFDGELAYQLASIGDQFYHRLSELDMPPRSKAMTLLASYGAF